MPIHDWKRVNAGTFHDFHHEWISTIKGALNNGLLPPEYYAMAEQVAGGLGPDVLTLEYNRTGGDTNGHSSSTSPTSTSVTLATVPPKVRFTASAELELYAHRRKTVTIRHVSGDRVVAVIEIVSPGNKASRHSLQKFVSKAIEFLGAGIHLLVIDPFPPTRRDPQGIHGAIWSEFEDNEFQLPADKPLTLAAYSAGTVKQAFIEPVAVGDVLPEMPLFLEPDEYVLVPLETAYISAYEHVPRRWQLELDREC